ncbi:uncharacterized protein LOC134811961 [Bolinopsis microptera]|uniref:uncharacterized protein LOC134811961 n=1 Tax=Bolinopsis microptera TaxID=2820187 RepID=UPI00307AE1F1
MLLGCIGSHHDIGPFLRSRDRNRAMNNQFKVLFRQSEAEFKSFMRLTKRQFYEVLALIEDDIAKDSSTSRIGISAKEQLMVTLRYLAGGENHKTLSLYFMIGRPTISKFIPKVLKAIITHLGPIHAKYVNTIGAIDGKHVVMIKPRSSGSTYFNYK